MNEPLVITRMRKNRVQNQCACLLAATSLRSVILMVMVYVVAVGKEDTHFPLTGKNLRAGVALSTAKPESSLLMGAIILIMMMT